MPHFIPLRPILVHTDQILLIRMSYIGACRSQASYLEATIGLYRSRIGAYKHIIVTYRPTIC